jgi:hypothetical protein
VIVRLATCLAAAIGGVVLSFAALAVSGLTGLPLPFLLVTGPAGVVLAGRTDGGPWVLASLALTGLLYSAYAFVLQRFGRRSVVWLVAFHGAGMALASAVLIP